MLSLPADILTEFAKSIVYIKTLVTLELTSRTFYWTDCDQDVYSGSKWYKSHPITFEPIKLGQELQSNSIRMVVSNVDKKFSDLALSENIQNKVCQINRIYLSKDLAVIGNPVLMFYGYTDQIKIDKRQAEIEIADEMIKWATPCPRRIHQNKCTWREFKGIECGYSGSETWCDRSYLRCVALSNQNNFGGFRFVTELQDKEIWWGRLQKSWNNAVNWAQRAGIM